MRILCLNPAPLGNISKDDLLVKEGRCMERSGAWSNLRMPITLAYISAILKQDGHEVRLLDNIAMKYLGRPVDIQKLIGSFEPDMLTLNTSIPSVLNEDLENARIAKGINKNIVTAMFGVAPTLIPDEILKTGTIDICMRKEPELTVKEICKAIRDKKSLKGVKGISFLHEGKIVHNGDPEELIDLDSLPFPDYESLPLDAYRTPVDKDRQVLIDASRGCPHQCIYCTGTKYYGHVFRHRDPKKVADEMEHVSRLGVKKVLFWADTFTLDNDFVYRLCDEITERGLEQKMSWIVNSRVNTVTPNLFKKMDEAGCFLIGFGVESGVQEILDYMNKGIKLQDSINAFRWIKETNILAASHAVFGLAPFETAKTVKQTIDFVYNKLGPNYANFHIAIPYPGTKLYEIYEKGGYIINRNFSLLESINANIRLPHLSEDDLIYWRNYAFYHFYFKKNFILQEIKKLRSVREAYNLITNGLWFLNGWVNAKK
jgi:anaerobic magnesium-protoporphyrin IX monomethyl ester cyclase